MMDSALRRHRECGPKSLIYHRLLRENAWMLQQKEEEEQEREADCEVGVVKFEPVLGPG